MGASDDPSLAALDEGEKAAIALGLSLSADLVLIDERRGAAAARGKGFEVTGTLGVLDLAARPACSILPMRSHVCELQISADEKNFSMLCSGNMSNFAVPEELSTENLAVGK